MSALAEALVAAQAELPCSRDQCLDFPDDPSEEPTLDEIKSYALRYEDSVILDVRSGMRDA